MVMCVRCVCVCCWGVGSYLYALTDGRPFGLGLWEQEITSSWFHIALPPVYWKPPESTSLSKTVSCSREGDKGTRL